MECGFEKRTQEFKRMEFNRKEELKIRRIGFIGLGNMGGRMAKNLHNAGYPLIGYDIDAAKCAALAR